MAALLGWIFVLWFKCREGCLVLLGMVRCLVLAALMLVRSRNVACSGIGAGRIAARCSSLRRLPLSEGSRKSGVADVRCGARHTRLDVADLG